MNTPQPAQRRPISVVIAVDPAPLKGVDDFNLTAVSASEGFTVDQPVIVGQHPRNGAQSLTIMVRVYPSPPSPPAAPTVRWWLARANPGEAPARLGSAQLAVRNDDASAPDRRAIIILITVDPAPVRREDIFKIAAVSTTEGYTVDSPVVLGQHSQNAGQSLTLKFCVYPSPPPPNGPLVSAWLINADSRTFGRLVRQARERAGFTRAELARQTGLSQLTICNVETGALACSLKTRNALLEALAQAVQELSAEGPEPQ